VDWKRVPVGGTLIGESQAKQLTSRVNIAQLARIHTHDNSAAGSERADTARSSANAACLRRQTDLLAFDGW